MKRFILIILLAVCLFNVPVFINATVIRMDKSDEETIAQKKITSYLDMNEDDIVERYHGYIDLGLPLLVITTDEGRDPTFETGTPPEGAVGNGTVNAEKLPGTIRRIEPDGVISYESGDYVKGISGCTLKVRGNGSARRVKKPYKIKLQKKADLMMRGDDIYKDKNWILILETRMHTNFGLFVNSLFDYGWTPATEFVNVIINDEFRGMYLLVEGIERNEKCRLPVSKDGFVIENDCYWWTDNGEYINSQDHPVANYTFKYPDYDEMAEQDLSWIQNRINDYEESITNGTFEDYIDLRSFASWVLCHDLLGTEDMLGANRFLYLRNREEGSKFEMGPVWDLDTSETIVEEFGKIHATPHLIMSKLLYGENPIMKDTYNALWLTKGEEIYHQIISELNKMREMGNKAYDASAEANNLTWEATWPVPVQKWESVIDAKLEYFAKRKAWLDANIHEREDISVDEIEDDSYHDNSPVFNINGIYVGTLKTFTEQRDKEKGIYVVRGKNRSRKMVM